MRLCTIRGFRTLLPGITLAVLSGCASYAVPGRGANLGPMGMTPAQRDQQTDPSISKLLDRKPLAKFPASIAIVRLEADRYANSKLQIFQTGAYTVVLTHDVEKPEQFDGLAKLPMIAELEPLNRLELTHTPADQSQADPTAVLRAAAATVHADMLLIYTFDDSFDDRDLAEVATVITLGIFPSKSLTVTSTASAVLIDTRNGYVYGAAETSEKQSTIANCWGENAAADALREQTESKAFDKLCGELHHSWGGVIKQYAVGSATQP